MNKLAPIRVVVANSATAKLYQFDKNSQTLHLTDTHDHIESTMKKSELIAGSAGRYQKSVNPNQGTYEPPTDPKTLEAEIFARELGEQINKEVQKQKFSKLLFIAPGKFQSKFKSHIVNGLKLGTKFVVADYTKLDDKSLEIHVKELVRDINVFE